MRLYQTPLSLTIHRPLTHRFASFSPLGHPLPSRAVTPWGSYSCVLVRHICASRSPSHRGPRRQQLEGIGGWRPRPWDNDLDSQRPQIFASGLRSRASPSIGALYVERHGRPERRALRRHDVCKYLQWEMQRSLGKLKPHSSIVAHCHC